MKQDTYPSVEEMLSQVPKILPWTAYPVCEKCGGGLGRGVPLLRFILGGLGRCAQNYCYCPGDQNSTIALPVQQVLSGYIGVGMANVPVQCFGVYEEHIHCRCGRCSWSWLMAVRSQRCPVNG